MNNPSRAELASHLAVCECNYARLRKLMRNPIMRNGWHVHCPLSVGLTLAVDFRVVEQGNHTATLWLEQYLMDADGTALADPVQQALDVQDAQRCWRALAAIKIRLYHDSKSAEVLEIIAQYSPRYRCPGQSMYAPDGSLVEKFQGNRFLAELLEFCLTDGISEPGILGRKQTSPIDL